MNELELNQPSNAVTNGRINRNFKLMMLNFGVSSFGMSSFSIVLLWITLSLTGSPVLTGLADGITSIPLFLSFIVGAVVDGMKRKKFAAMSVSIARAASAALMFISLESGNILIIVGSIYSTAFLVGLTSDFLNSIRASWIKTFLDENQFKSGASFNQAVSSIAEGLGFFASGAILVLGYSTAITGMAAIFLASFIPLIFIKYNEAAPEGEGTLGHSISEGLKYIWKTKFVRQLMFLMLSLNLFFSMTGVMFTVLIKTRFGLPSTYLGSIFLALTVGIILGSAVASRVKGKLGTYVFSGIAAMGILFILISVISVALVDLIPMFLMGLAVGVINVLILSVMITIIPQNMMARVQGSLNTFALGVTFISGTIGGALISLTSLEDTFILVGTVNLATAVIFLTFKEFRATEI